MYTIRIRWELDVPSNVAHLRSGNSLDWSSTSTCGKEVSGQWGDLEPDFQKCAECANIDNRSRQMPDWAVSIRHSPEFLARAARR